MPQPFVSSHRAHVSAASTLSYTPECVPANTWAPVGSSGCTHTADTAVSHRPRLLRSQWRPASVVRITPDETPLFWPPAKMRLGLVLGDAAEARVPASPQ